MKKWFVIFPDHHLGPFNKDEVRELYTTGEISDTVRIWSESSGDPIPLRRFLGESVTPHKNDRIEEDDELPPLPEVTVAGKVKQARYELEKTTIEPSEVTSVEKKIIESGKTSPTKKTVGKKRVVPFLVAVVVLVLATVGIFSIVNERIIGKNTRLTISSSELEIEAIEYLEDCINQVEQSKSVICFRLSKDKKKLWAATNLKGTGSVQAQFKSIEDKILGNNTIFNAEGELNEHLISFTNIYFKEGSRLLDGYYDVKVDSAHEITQYLFKIIKISSRKLTLNGKYLVSSVPESSYKAMLVKYHQGLIRNNQKFEKELNQKLQTIKMIVKQIIAAMNKVKSKETSRKFEQEYKEKFGIFFTSFVFDNETQYKEISTENFKDKITTLKNYSKLTNLAKDIGKVSSEAIFEFQQAESTQEILFIRNQKIREFDKIIISTRNFFEL